LCGIANEVNDTWLEANTTYYYRAKARQYYSSGESGYSNIASATTLVLTIPEASARVTALYNAQLITGTDLYNFLIDHLNSANAFYNSDDFDSAIGELVVVQDKILFEAGDNIELMSGLLLHEYLSDLCYGLRGKTTPPATPADKASEQIDNHAKEKIKEVNGSNLSDDEKKNRIDTINGITGTVKTALMAPPQGYGTTSAKHSDVIKTWGKDWITNAAQGATSTLTAGYGGSGIILPPEWGAPGPNGIYEVAKGRNYQISIVVAGPPTATTKSKITISSQPVPAVTTNSANKVTQTADGQGTTLLDATIDCKFANGNTCDLVYIRIEIIDIPTTETKKTIYGNKILVHLKDP
jgi:hypothetical protein